MYNLEVWRDHNYFVGSSNILVQDGCSGAVKKAIIDAMVQKANVHAKLNKCRESAKTMRDFLLSKGIKDFDIVLLKTVDLFNGKFVKTFMISDFYNNGKTAIAENGIHVFIVINGKAYDNLSKGVVDAQEYLKSFQVRLGCKVKDVHLKHTDDLDGDFTDF